MKRKLFDELKEGIGALQSEREGKLTLLRKNPNGQRGKDNAEMGGGFSLPIRIAFTSWKCFDKSANVVGAYISGEEKYCNARIDPEFSLRR